MRSSDSKSMLMQQLGHELNTWQRAVDYILQENVHLKNRLAEVIKGLSGNHLLIQAENFQQQFINKDAVIALLRRDITEQKNQEAALLSRHEKLRRDVEMIEKEFNRLKFDFNTFVTVNLIDHTR